MKRQLLGSVVPQHYILEDINSDNQQRWLGEGQVKVGVEGMAVEETAPEDVTVEPAAVEQEFETVRQDLLKNSKGHQLT